MPNSLPLATNGELAWIKRTKPSPYTKTTPPPHKHHTQYTTIPEPMQHELSKLIIYNASAGSGKTFTLVLNYLALALQHPDNPALFRHILCITFTRKATAEMKQRILLNLKKLAQNDPKCEMRRPLVELHNIPEDQIAQRARNTLNLIIDEYEALAVSTIDSFIQKLTQGLLWELGYANALDVSLNQALFFAQAAERLLDDLKPHSPLYQWIDNHTRDQREKQKKWQIQNDIARLADELFKDNFLQIPPQQRQLLFDPNRAILINQRLTRAFNDINLLLQHLAKSGNDLRQIAQNLGIQEKDFSYGKASGWASFLNAIEDPEKFNPQHKPSRCIDCALEPDAWLSKKTKDSEQGPALLNAISNKLFAPFQKMVQQWLMTKPELATLQALKEREPYLAMLNKLREALYRIEKENGTLLLADMYTLLIDLISTQNAEFICERLGIRYDHIAIDEFQDTSTVQWLILKHFVDNALAQGHAPTLVGDVKQAIYRWRGGNAKLMAETLPRHYNDRIENLNLEYNYRSLPNIIQFNNQLFSLLLQFNDHLYLCSPDDTIPMHLRSLAEEQIPQINPVLTPQMNHIANESYNIVNNYYHEFLKKAYASVQQKLPPNSKKTHGRIQWMSFAQTIERTDSTTPEEKAPRMTLSEKFTIILDAMLKTLDMLIHQQNVRPNDIAILVRRNSTGARVVEAITRHNATQPDHLIYSAVTAQAQPLYDAPDVKALIAALRIAAGEMNDYDRIYLQKAISRASTLDQPFFENAVKRTSYSQSTPPSTDPPKQTYTQIPDAIRFLKRYRNAPLIEAYDAIVLGLKLPTTPDQLAHIMALRQVIIDYQKENGPALYSFAKAHADTNIDLGQIELTDNPKAVNVITINKAKGLEFKHVLCIENDFPFIQNTNQVTLWDNVQLDENGPEYLPFSLAHAKSSFLYQKTIHEHCDALTDALNLLYVAFTRAEQGLYIFTVDPQDEKPQKGTHASMGYHLRHNLIKINWERAHQTCLTLPSQSSDPDSSNRTGHPYAPAQYIVPCTIRTWGALPPDLSNQLKQEKPNGIQRMKPIPSENQKRFPTTRVRLATPKLANARREKNTSTQATSAEIEEKAYRLDRIDLGEKLHKAFTELPDYQRVLQAIKRLYKDQYITDLQLHNLTSMIEQEKARSTASPLNLPHAKIRKEKDWIVDSGTKRSRLRPDLVIELQNQTIVIDYKFGEPRQKYHDQVKQYMTLLQNMHYPNVSGEIWYFNPDHPASSREAVNP